MLWGSLGYFLRPPTKLLVDSLWPLLALWAFQVPPLQLEFSSLYGTSPWTFTIPAHHQPEWYFLKYEFCSRWQRWSGQACGINAITEQSCTSLVMLDPWGLWLFRLSSTVPGWVEMALHLSEYWQWGNLQEEPLGRGKSGDTGPMLRGTMTLCKPSLQD